MIRRRWRGRAQAWVFSLVVAGAGGADAAAGSFFLSITGAEDARYEGHCTLTTASGEERLKLSGAVPRREELRGEALTCRIKTDGLVAVEVTHNGNRSRSVTNRGEVNISVR